MLEKNGTHSNWSVSVLAKCQQQGWRVEMDEPVGNTLRLSSESYGC